MPNRRCPKCDYDLRRHGPRGVCPECGERYRPTINPPPLRTARRRQWLLFHCAIMAVLIIVNAAGLWLGPAGFPRMTAFWTVAAVVNFVPLVVLTALDRVALEMWTIEWAIVLISIAMVIVNA